MRISGSGNVGIGTTTPNNTLHVNGVSSFGDSTYYGRVFHSGSAGNFHLDTFGAGKMFLNWYSGNGVSVGNGASGFGPIAASAFNVSSDRRLKTDIQPIDDALNRLLGLTGYYFRYKSASDGRLQVGLMAQEVETVYPEVVSVNDDGYRQVNYSGLVGPLVAAVKDLKQQKDDEIARLKAEIEQTRAALTTATMRHEDEQTSLAGKIAQLKAQADQAAAEAARVKAALCSIKDLPICHE